jgi:DNA-binding NarL/FixJ family response regulator
MGGIEAITRLQAIDPDVEPIVSSGYSNDPVMADFRSFGFAMAVKKPYMIHEMSQALSAVLTGDEDA